MHEMSYMGRRGKHSLFLNPNFRRQQRPANLADSTATAFNHSQSNDAEAEYDRLRDLARQEATKRGSCFQRVRLPSSPSLSQATTTTTIITSL
jgi:hypothetical protein